MLIHVKMNIIFEFSLTRAFQRYPSWYISNFLIFGLNHLGDLGADHDDLDDIVIEVEVVEVVEAVI